MREPTGRLLRAVTLAAAGIVLATLLIWALANGLLVTLRWEFDDIHAYLGAAQRLMDGRPLYTAPSDVSDYFLYAPWFAVAWVPLTLLPTLAVEVGWAGVLLVAMVVAVAPFRRSLSSIALALLLGGLLYRTVGWGNVQPLAVAALVCALPTRAGPWVAGVTASLKPWPLLVVGVYAWRREWRACAITLGVALLLWAPVLLFNWTDYPLGSRSPNIYDATFLLAVPGLVRPTRFAVAWPGRRAGSRSRTPAAAVG